MGAGILLALLGIAGVRTELVQVLPPRRAVDGFARSEGQARAVLLIHGMRLHPFSGKRAAKPGFHGWQDEDSKVCEELGRDSDLYAFAYGQDVPVDEVARAPALLDGLERLRALGYSEIVAIGHSAGGVIARTLVEDRPDCGVTKVIQVCAPNSGTWFAKCTIAVCERQEPFLRSLSRKARRERAGKTIPAHVQFICVVGDAGEAGDFLVRDDAQWPGDLRAQGIPAEALRTSHWTSVHSRRVARRLAALVRDPIPRWTRDEVAAAEKRILELY
jgi:pimeloyl-ACP methyl ester carboxylesterase